MIFWYNVLLQSTEFQWQYRHKVTKHKTIKSVQKRLKVFGFSSFFREYSKWEIPDFGKETSANTKSQWQQAESQKPYISNRENRHIHQNQNAKERFPATKKIG